MASIQTVGKAAAVAVIIRQLTGVQPQVEEKDNYVRLYFRSSDYPAVRSVLEKMISSRGIPSDVKIDWLPVAGPIAAKKVLPIAVGLFAAGYLIGKFL